MKSEVVAWIVAAMFGLVAFVYAAMGVARFRESGFFGAVFLAVGGYAGYLAWRILARRRVLFSDIAGFINKNKVRLMGAMLFGVVGWTLRRSDLGWLFLSPPATTYSAMAERRSDLGWLFLWPLWGTDTLVYMAAVFAENELGLPDIGILLKVFALAFEGVYLFFLSGLALRASTLLRSYR